MGGAQSVHTYRPMCRPYPSRISPGEPPVGVDENSIKFIVKGGQATLRASTTKGVEQSFLCERARSARVVTQILDAHANVNSNWRWRRGGDRTGSMTGVPLPRRSTTSRRKMGGVAAGEFEFLVSRMFPRVSAKTTAPALQPMLPSSPYLTVGHSLLLNQKRSFQKLLPNESP